jgi:hypothetical protein
VIASAEGPAGDPKYWDRWPQIYTHLYVFGAEPGWANPSPQRLRLLHEGVGFQLYQVVGPAEPDGGKGM